MRFLIEYKLDGQTDEMEVEGDDWEKEFESKMFLKKKAASTLILTP